jgi:hypothetical protein
MRPVKPTQPLGLFAVFALGGIFFGYAAGSKDFGSLGLGAAFATFAAALAGAWGAFLLESRRRDQEETARRVGAGNRALFDLSMMLNGFLLFQQRHVSGLHGQDPNTYWCILPATLMAQTRRDVVDFARLEFLLESPNANLLILLQIQHERYKQFVDLLERRAALLTGYAQPRWEAAGIPQHLTTNEALRAAAGPALYGQISSLTSTVLDFLPENIAECRGMFDALRAHLKATFPDRKFIQLSDAEPAALQVTP